MGCCDKCTQRRIKSCSEREWEKMVHFMLQSRGKVYPQLRYKITSLQCVETLSLQQRRESNSNSWKNKYYPCCCTNANVPQYHRDAYKHINTLTMSIVCLRCHYLQDTRHHKDSPHSFSFYKKFCKKNKYILGLLPKSIWHNLAILAVMWTFLDN